MPKLTPAGLLIIFFTVAFTVIGQLLVKKGVQEVGASPTSTSLLLAFVWRVFTNLYVLLGLTCAVLAAVAWTIALSRVALSVAYPFLGLGIVLVLALSGVVFGESVPASRWIGVAIVCIGLVVAAIG